MLKKTIPLCITIILANVAVSAELSLQERLDNLGLQVSSLDSLIQNNSVLADLKFETAKTTFETNPTVMDVLKQLDVSDQNSTLQEILTQKKFAYGILESAIHDSEIKEIRAMSDDALFKLNFFDKKNDIRIIARERLNGGNRALFLSQQEGLCLTLTPAQFQSDPRVEWLITKLGRTFTSEVSDNFTELQALIDNDGIRKLGYSSIETLQNAFFGSKTDAVIDQATHKISHEAGRVGKQAEKVVQKIFRKRW
jgi:hypothetical protein